MKEFEENLRYLLLYRRGGANRAKILNQLRIGPSNANQLALNLNLNYRTIQHHLDIMMEHNLIRVVKKGGYGDMYNLDPELAFADVVVKEIISNAQRKELFKDLAGSADLDKIGVDSTNVGFLLIDTDGRIRWSNQGFKNITGRHQPLKGEMAEKYFRSSLKDALLKMDHDKGTITNFRTMLHRSDGSEISVSVTVDLIDGEEFSKGYSIVIREDIDPPHEGDQKCDPTLKDQYDDLLAMVPMGIIIIEGAQGNVRYINSAAEEMFGKGMMDTPFIGQSEKYRILQNSGRSYVTQDLPLFRAISTGERVDHAEMVIDRIDGKRMHVLSSCSPLKDKMGRMLGAIGAFSDITEISDLKRVQESIKAYQVELNVQNNELFRSQRDLERSRNEYFDLFDNSPISTFKLDPIGLITDANMMGCQLIGMIRSHLLNRPLVNIVRSADRDRARQYIQEIVQRRKRDPIEIGIIGPDDEEIMVDLTCRPVDPPREDFACVAVIIDRGGASLNGDYTLDRDIGSKVPDDNEIIQGELDEERAL